MTDKRYCLDLVCEPMHEWSLRLVYLELTADGDVILSFRKDYLA